jgi:rubrerythrin
VEQVGVEVDQSTVASASQPAAPLDDSGFAEFVVTGTPVSGDFRCAECGYGAVVHRALPQCPMCGGTVWERLEQSASRLVR